MTETEKFVSSGLTPNQFRRMRNQEELAFRCEQDFQKFRWDTRWPEAIARWLETIRTTTQGSKT